MLTNIPQPPLRRLRQRQPFVRAESGATAIEYGLIAAMLAVAGVMAFGSSGTAVRSTVTQTSAAIDDVIPPGKTKGCEPDCPPGS